MSIESTAFGVTRLTDEDSAKFRRQIANGRASKPAAESLKSGLVLAQKVGKKGYVSIAIKKRPK
jgi:hypothetical protein